jgi:DNA (cytosine-5)-methyltransferase 1
MKNKTEFDLKAEGRPISVLNLYAGIGGNRKLWPENVKVTAVEFDKDIAKVYQENFPNDTVIVADAHQYLLDHFSEFDFIWSSFPCTTHTRMNVNFSIIRFPDLGLYQEIIFLHSFFKGKWCVENVIPYYTLVIPEVPVQQYNRHLFWCNFKIKQTDKRNPPKQIQSIIAQKTKHKIKNHTGGVVYSKPNQPDFGFDLSNVSSKIHKDKMLRNCVDPELGIMIFQCAVGAFKSNSIHQTDLWNT